MDSAVSRSAAFTLQPVNCSHHEPLGHLNKIHSLRAGLRHQLKSRRHSRTNMPETISKKLRQRARVRWLILFAGMEGRDQLREALQ